MFWIYSIQDRGYKYSILYIPVANNDLMQSEIKKDLQKQKVGGFKINKQNNKRKNKLWMNQMKFCPRICAVVIELPFWEPYCITMTKVT